MTAAAAAKIDPARHIGLARLFAQPLARRMPHLADDLHAAALLAVVEAAAIYDPASGGKFSVWVLWQCRHHFTRILRMERPRGYREVSRRAPRTVSLSAAIRATAAGHGTPLELAAAIEDPRDDRAAAEGRDAFEALLRGLRPRQAEALRLSYRDGLSHEEIAARWGVSQQAVSQSVSRSLAVLRGRLESRRATA